MDSIKDLKTSIHEALVDILGNPNNEVSRLVLADMLDDLVESQNTKLCLLRQPGFWSIIPFDRTDKCCAFGRYLTWKCVDNKSIKVARTRTSIRCGECGEFKRILRTSPNYNWGWLCDGCYHKVKRRKNNSNYRPKISNNNNHGTILQEDNSYNGHGQP